MSNPILLSSAIWTATAGVSLAWGLSHPFPSINKFYGFAAGTLAASVGACLSYPAMKRSERHIIRQDTADTIFDLGEVAIIERYKQMAFPVPPMPDIHTHQHLYQLGLEQSLEQSPDEPPRVPIENVLRRGVGICLLGDSGSGKTSAAKYLIGEFSQGREVELAVADPHFDGSNGWGEDTLIIYDYPDILKALQTALDELDKRKAQKRQGVKSFPFRVYIWDEWPSVRAYAKQQKSGICEDAIIRLGSECRKFDMLSIFCSQSGNTKAMGLEGQGDFLQNFSLIRLGKIAVKYAKNLPDQRILNCLQSVGYPCMVDDDLSTHPTHGFYQQFAEGQQPIGLKQIQVKAVDLAEILGDRNGFRSDDVDEFETGNYSPSPNDKTFSFNLTKNPEGEQPDLSLEQSRILRFIKDKFEGNCKLNDILKGMTITTNGQRWAKQNYLNALYYIESKGYLSLSIEGDTVWIQVTG